MSNIPVTQARNNSIGRAAGCLLLLAGALLGPPPLQATPFEEALDAYHAGDYQRAIEQWKTLPNDPRALFNLGQMYRRGEGVDINEQVAIAYYERAAAMGHRSAQSNLGTLHFFADPPRPDQAIHWWRIAAIAGEPHAQHMMGVIYVNGEHAERDLIKGYAWNHIAAAQEYGKAQEAIATLDEYLTQDEIEAAKALAVSLLQQPVELAHAAPIETQPGAPAAPTESDTAAAAGYWIQFGALSSEAAARKLWQQLSADHPELTRDMASRISPIRVRGKTLQRLQAGSFELREAARQRCAQFESAGVTCLVKASSH